MKAVKVTIVLILIVALAGAGIAQAAYYKGYRMGYIYTPTGEFDDGFAKGTNWEWNGEKELWSIDELRDLATYCRVSVTGLYGGGPKGLAFTLLSDKVLVVPGLTLEDHITDQYYLSF